MADNKLPILDLEYRHPGDSSVADKMIDLNCIQSIESNRSTATVRMVSGYTFEVPSTVGKFIADHWTKDREVIPFKEEEPKKNSMNVSLR